MEARIGYRFSDAELLRRALTHSSLANETRTGPGSPQGDNEQLEFLGDSILGFLVAEILVLRNPGFHEGELSQLKAHLVSAAHLHGVARRLDLGECLELGRSEEMSGGRAKKTLLVDGLEALIAAVYLDGGIEVARSFISEHVLDAPPAGDEEFGFETHPSITNFKSALQELAQSLHLPQPRYVMLHERGPEHSKLFTVEVRVGKEWSGQAEARTKKVAAQRAARGVYDRLLEQSRNGEGSGPAESSSAPPSAAAANPEN